jgi:uncharacterized protein (TIGR03066 family)
MKSIVAAVAAAAVLVGVVAAQDKKDPKKDDKKVDAAKLLGRWELTRSTLDPRPKSAIVEFTKDNKVTVAVTAGNGKEDKYTGTYKVNGDKLTVKLTIPGETDQEDTDTIQTLTDEKLLLIDKDKKETEFAKKK